MYAWSNIFAYPYETAWSILQKLTLLNGIKPLVLLRDVCSTRVSVSQNYSNERQAQTFVDTEWVSKGPWRNAGLPSVTKAGMALQHELIRHGGQIYLGNLAKRLLTCTLRICPECISLGFHCIAHQIEGIRRCPMHDVELVSKCPSCGKSLLRFEACAWFKSFRCPVCDKSLLREVVPKPPSKDFKELIFTRIEPLIAWLNSFQDHPIAWPDTPHNLPLRVTEGDIGEMTTFREGILWAFHKCHPFEDGVDCFGPEPDHFFLKSTYGAREVDNWRASIRDLSRAYVQKHVDAARCLVIEVFKEERKVVVGAAEKHGECCDRMSAYFCALAQGADDDFVFLEDSYCGFGRTFYLWEFYLKRGLDDLKESIRFGWVPEFDAAFKEVIRQDIQTLFSVCAHVVAREQNVREVEQDQVHKTFDLGPHPLFSINGERSKWVHRGQYGPASFVFHLQDEGGLTHLRCDQRRVVEEHRRRQRELMEGMEEYREQKRLRAMHAGFSKGSDI